MSQTPFANWQSVLDAPRSTFFRGRTSDAAADRAVSGEACMPSAEALFTQSNARVLIGQSADVRLRFVALPTQVYPAPTGEGEFNLGPGMFHHFDVAMYAGDLSYRIALDDGTAIDLSAPDRDNETCYADHFLPVTRARAGGLDIALIGFAPAAPDAGAAPLSPAPLPGPAGAVFRHSIFTMEVVG